MLESVVEAYLVKRVLKLGGEIRKVEWIGRRGAPDRFVLLLHGESFWAELKRPKGTAEAHQLREHERMRKYGQRVEVLDSKEAIDYYFVCRGLL